MFPFHFTCCSPVSTDMEQATRQRHIRTLRPRVLLVQNRSIGLFRLQVTTPFSHKEMNRKLAAGCTLCCAVHTTWCDGPKVRHLHTRRHQNLRSHYWKFNCSVHTAENSIIHSTECNEFFPGDEPEVGKYGAAPQRYSQPVSARRQGRSSRFASKNSFFYGQVYQDFLNATTSIRRKYIHVYVSLGRAYRYDRKQTKTPVISVCPIYLPAVWTASNLHPRQPLRFTKAQTCKYEFADIWNRTVFSKYTQTKAGRSQHIYFSIHLHSRMVHVTTFSTHPITQCIT